MSGNLFSLALGAVLVRLFFIFASRERERERSAKSREKKRKEKEELSLPSSVCIASLLSMTTTVEFFTNERCCRGCSFYVQQRRI
jgi:hypothetical protein